MQGQVTTSNAFLLLSMSLQGCCECAFLAMLYWSGHLNMCFDCPIGPTSLLLRAASFSCVSYLWLVCTRGLHLRPSPLSIVISKSVCSHTKTAEGLLGCRFYFTLELDRVRPYQHARLAKLRGPRKPVQQGTLRGTLHLSTPA